MSLSIYITFHANRYASLFIYLFFFLFTVLHPRIMSFTNIYTTYSSHSLSSLYLISLPRPFERCHKRTRATVSELASDLAAGCTHLTEHSIHSRLSLLPGRSQPSLVHHRADASHYSRASFVVLATLGFKSLKEESRLNLA